jgi:hypothetical protein
MLSPNAGKRRQTLTAELAQLIPVIDEERQFIR